MENENATAEPQVTASNHKRLINADKYVVLADGRLAKLVKPVKVKKYEYYTYRTNDGRVLRVNKDDVFSRTV
jgi:hypothetical protein